MKVPNLVLFVIENSLTFFFGGGVNVEQKSLKQTFKSIFGLLTDVRIIIQTIAVLIRSFQ